MPEQVDPTSQNIVPVVSPAVVSHVNPKVYTSVRAIAVVKPTYNPRDGGTFDNNLQVVGTAFWLKDYKVLITCAHVVNGLLNGTPEQTGLLVVGNMGKYARAQIASLDLAHDLAVLKIFGMPQEFIDAEAATGLSIIDSYLPVGEAVSYSGFPLGSQLINSIHSPTYAEGVIGVQIREGLLRKEIQITGAVAGGYSGAPVVAKNRDSKVVGVVSNGPMSADSQGNIFMAISWEHVEAIAKLANS